ncbi:MAG: tripartite tricarboxylate transporter substrate binding protein [Betaproteobacteria bacterium]|nr:MAG: tripartite tricarboxylate transporter substrate binding protein [Betaproteobacteria bacterium]
MRTTVRTATAAARPTGSRRSSGCPGSKGGVMRKTAGILLLAFSAAVAAQNFPSKTVRFVSGVTPGSASDTMARILAEKLQQKWGQPVIVENKLGAGGLVGAKYVADSAPDGHMIMMYASAYTVAPLLSPNVLRFDELTPVAAVATIPTVLVTQPEKYKTIQEFVAKAKASPGKLVCADAGIGSATHMAFEKFRFAAGIPDVLNVHTKGVGEAITEVVSGRADCYFALVFQARKMVDSGKLVALATSSPKRSALMPNIPTTEELGYPNSHYNFWVGTLVPAKTPKAIVDKLHDDITALVESPEVNEKIRKLGCDPLPMSVKEFDDMIAGEIKENTALIKKAGIKAN